MEIFISGDACISIYTHLCPSDNTRPMALDLLWQVGTSCDFWEWRRRRLGEAPWRQRAVEPIVPCDPVLRLLQCCLLLPLHKLRRCGSVDGP